MAFRLQFMPQPVRVLNTSHAAVRERILHELGAAFSGAMLDTRSVRPEARDEGACLLPSGFHVEYCVDWQRGLLHLLELRSPEVLLPPP